MKWSERSINSDINHVMTRNFKISVGYRLLFCASNGGNCWVFLPTWPEIPDVFFMYFFSVANMFPQEGDGHSVIESYPPNRIIYIHSQKLRFLMPLAKMMVGRRSFHFGARPFFKGLWFFGCTKKTNTDFGSYASKIFKFIRFFCWKVIWKVSCREDRSCTKLTFRSHAEKRKKSSLGHWRPWLKKFPCMKHIMGI